MNTQRTSRDYTEDEVYENGKYECVCHECGMKFYGLKRRLICKECKNK